LIRRISEDLPAPLRPMTPMIAPSGTCRLMPSSATTSPVPFRAGYTLRMFSSRITVDDFDERPAGNGVPLCSNQGAFM